ncbi:MAG: hypothetical protein AAF990_20465 [Bacteroidota bacterium]
MNEDANNVLLLLGMHRSGTSLLGKWLHHCGLFVGRRLLGANKSNPGGHFEDLDFLEFHNDLLAFNQTVPLGEKPPNSFAIEPYHRQRASALATFKTQLNTHWAWKDPRSCLFLNNLWKEVLPDAKALIIFRDYKAVVQSLIRRDLQLLGKDFDKLEQLFGSLLSIARPLIKIRLHFFRKHYMRQIDHHIRLYLQNWIWHQQELKKFLENHHDPNASAIVAYEQLADQQGRLLQKVRKDWGFPLHSYPLADVRLRKPIVPIAKLYNHPWPQDLSRQAEQLLEYFRQHPQNLQHGA